MTLIVAVCWLVVVGVVLLVGLIEACRENPDLEREVLGCVFAVIFLAFLALTVWSAFVVASHLGLLPPSRMGPRPSAPVVLPGEEPRS